MPRWMIGALAAFFAIYCVTVLATGNPSYIVPVAVLAAIVLAGALANWLLSRRVVGRHESVRAAMADETEPLPSTHLIPDDETPAGDNPEAHDAIDPHDLPIDHPGRREADRLANERDRTTEGNR